jgi:hypothetical protein
VDRGLELVCQYKYLGVMEKSLSPSLISTLFFKRPIFWVKLNIISFNTVNMIQTKAPIAGAESTIFENTSLPGPPKSDMNAKAIPYTAASPPVYKIVKVRKPDGSIVKVKRPITAEGTEMQEPPFRAPYL